LSAILRSSARRAACLLAVLATAKAGLVAARLLEARVGGLVSPWTPAVFLYQSVWLALAVGALDLVVMRATRGRADRALWVMYALVIAWTAINFPIARILSTPLTADLLAGVGGALIDSILLYVTAANVVALLLIAAVAVALPQLAPRRAPRRLAAGLGAAAALVLALGPLGARRIETMGLHRDPLLCLAGSALARVRRPPAPREVPQVAAEGPTADLSSLVGAARGRSVVWVSLESTAAEYLRLYGAGRDPTPNLARLASSALVFDAAYASYPGSMKALYSMLCAMYPAPFTSTTVYRKAPCTSLPRALARAGYRTGFFHSGRFDYLSMHDVIAPHGFDERADASTIPARQTSPFGIDEPSTVAGVLAFVDRLPPEQRFLAVYAPIAGHHPYRWPGGPRPFGDRSMHDRYLNDLFRGDQALGMLVEGLRARGRLPGTLLVVSGDHGEAFDQHPGNAAHPMFIYDENVRVPLVIAAPGLWTAERRVPQPASLVDVSPTILALLGLPPPGAADGRSLLDPGPRVARFFTDFGVPHIGLRDGRWKLILDLEADRARLYDMAVGGEREDRAPLEPGRVERYRRHLAAWWRHQQHRIREGAQGEP
jgi:arylsulfatase A-like enzyme